MMGAPYRTKKELKAAVGQKLMYIETSLFGTEYKSTGTFCVVGPDPFYKRTWYAQVTMKNDVIVKVE
jgi:hypothetical protein